MKRNGLWIIACLVGVVGALWISTVRIDRDSSAPTTDVQLRAPLRARQLVVPAPAAAVAAGEQLPMPPAAPAATALPQRQCGREMWDLKVARDAQARFIERAPLRASIDEMVGWARPADAEHRVTVEQMTVLRVEGVVERVRFERDGDTHLVLRDPESGTSLIAELADPACAGGSVFAGEIGAVHAKLDGMRWGVVGKRVAVFGPALYDFEHGSYGAAPNGIEIHPVVRLDVLE